MYKLEDVLNDYMTVIPVLFKRISDFNSRILQKKNITKTHLIIMIILKKESILTMSGLGKTLHISKPNITKFIDKLIRLNFLERVLNEKDRRVIFVKLTKKGEEFLTEYNKEFKSHVKENLKIFDDNDIRMFRTIMDYSKKLLNKLEEK